MLFRSLSDALNALIYTNRNYSGILQLVMKQTDHDIEGFYRTESAALLRYIRRCGGGSASEDLLQDIFVTLLRKPEGLRKARSPKSWIYGVARRLVLGFIRKQSRSVELVIEPEAPSVPVEDARMVRLKSAMRKLPDSQREVLGLRLDAEMSYQEIADALNIPVGTVRSRLHNAVRSLRSTLEGKESEIGRAHV